MAIMNRLTCDRCGHNTLVNLGDEAPGGWTRIVYHDVPTSTNDGLGTLRGNEKPTDLCVDCTEDYDNFISTGGA